MAAREGSLRQPPPYSRWALCCAASQLGQAQSHPPLLPPAAQAQLGVHAQTPADAMQHDRVSAAQEAARLHASLQQRQQEAAKTAHDKELTRAKK